MTSDDATRLGPGRIQRATPRAILIRLDADGIDRWIPKSMIHDDSEVWDENEGNEHGEIVVKSWFAEKEGLI